MTDTSWADPPATHTDILAFPKEPTHVYTLHANAHHCVPSCIKCCHTLSLACRTRLATPRRASACSAQRAMAILICSSVMPPTTCRGFWVATPPGWAPLTPPCCKRSSVRVRAVCLCGVKVWLCVFLWIWWQTVAVAGGFLPVCVCVCECVHVCVSTAAVLIIVPSLQQASADGTGGRHPEPHPSVSSLPFCLPSPPSASLHLSSSLLGFIVFLFSPCVLPPVLHFYILVLLRPAASSCMQAGRAGHLLEGLIG